jgi:hypothetical protein
VKHFADAATPLTAANLALGILIALGIGTGTTALSSPNTDNENPTTTKLVCCLPYSPMEGAYSRGSGGFSIGTGVDNLAPQSNQHPQEALARYYFNKGVVWPINAGLSAGASSGGSYRELGGHVQVALFESFAVPTVALRAYGNWGFDDDRTLGKVGGASLVAQHALLSFFSIYGTFGRERQFLEPEMPLEATTIREGSNWSAGTEITIVPPFVQLTIEYRATLDSQQILAVKTAIAM